MKISLFGVEHEQAALALELKAAFARVLESGKFVLGPEVTAFEAEVAEYLGVKHAVGVSSGSDALVCALRAVGASPGSEVVTPAFSFFAPAESVVRVGAVPRLVDVKLETLAMDVEAAGAAFGRRTAAVLPVHLYGAPVALGRLTELAAAANVAVIEDAAQAFGASLQGRRLGTWGSLGCFSFFPTKPLGGFGDGGMIVTDDAELGERCRRLRVHGASDKHRHDEVGGNFRLDALQAALLRVKLPHVDGWRRARAERVRRYREGLGDVSALALLEVPPEAESAEALFTLRVLDGQREALVAALSKVGIETAVYYPRALHVQPALTALGYREGQFPNAELACRQVLSLPLSAGLSLEQVDVVIDAVRGFFR